MRCRWAICACAPGRTDLQRAGEPESGAAVEEPVRTGRTRLLAAYCACQAPKSIGSDAFYPSPGMELDLRGQRAEDALDRFDRYLESAYLAGLPFVRIIHGKGTGRLRQVIRDSLGQSPHVKNWESGGR